MPVILVIIVVALVWVRVVHRICTSRDAEALSLYDDAEAVRKQRRGGPTTPGTLRRGSRGSVLERIDEEELPPARSMTIHEESQLRAERAAWARLAEKRDADLEVWTRLAT